MARPDGTTRVHSARSLAGSLLLFCLAAAWVSAFWSRAASFLPAPLDRWGGFYGQLLGPWSRERAFGFLGPGEQLLLVWVGANFVVGAIVPALLLALWGRRLADVGLAVPNRLGLRWIPVGVLLAVPFGLWLFGAAPPPPGSPWITFRSACGLVSMIPEHFLVFGTCIAMMLPERRLPRPVPVSALAGSRWQRALGWLGLAQPATPGHNRVLAWLGLTGTSLFAILLAGLLFWIVHLGKPNPRDVISSLPSGVVMAYLTLRAASIWPALLVHWAMNLIPPGLLILLR